MAACRQELRRLLALRDSDELTAADARRLREHLAECAPCREAAVAQDPTLLFLSLAGEEDTAPKRGPRRTSAADLEAERLVADVLAAVDVERSRRRLSRARPVSRAFLRAASIALLGGVLGALFLARQPLRELLAGGNRPAVAEARAVARPVPAAVQAAPLRPVLEDLKNPGATVYEFASSSPQEPTVVFVVDRNADL